MHTEWARSAPATGPSPGQDPPVGVESPGDHLAPPPDPHRRESSRRSLPSRVKLALVAADLAATAVGLLAATFIYRLLQPSSAGDLLKIGLVSLPIWSVLYAHQGLYQARRVGRRLEELRRLVNAVLAGSLVLAGMSVLLQTTMSRGWLVLAAATITVSVFGEREVARRIIQGMRFRGVMTRRVVVVGRNSEAEEIAEALLEFPELGYEVVGFVADIPDASTDRGTTGKVIDLRTGRPLGPYLGQTDEVLDLVRATGATGVIVATTGTDQESANRLIRELTREGLYVEMTSAMRDISSARISVRPLGRYPVVCVEPVANLSWRAAAKRAFDIVAASIGFLITLPVVAVAAAAIRLTSGPNVVFRQERVGRNGEVFTLYKLRTMVPDAEQRLAELRDRNEAPGPMFKMTDDPRVTPVGAFLRKFSIDEIPQLVNVIKGDMSMVGPRPALPGEAEQWDDALRERLRVQPGITGMWQVSGRYTATLETYARLDLFYVDNWSLVTDLAILLKTIPVVIRRKGAA
jgi:exopolysaccharide biosynthesis polyprenyl glycosylphosphotransferase